MTHNNTKVLNRLIIESEESIPAQFISNSMLNCSTLKLDDLKGRDYKSDSEVSQKKVKFSFSSLTHRSNRFSCSVTAKFSCMVSTAVSPDYFLQKLMNERGYNTTAIDMKSFIRYLYACL